MNRWIGYMFICLGWASIAAKSNDRERSPTPGVTSRSGLDSQTDAKSSPAAKTYSKEQAKKIVKDAEAIRALDRSRAKISVETITGKQKTNYDMDILQAPGRKAYLEFVAPDEERGRRMLAIKTNYWSKFPDSKRIVSISRREAIGNSAFAIADVFQMDVESDYDPAILGEEPLNGIPCFKVELKAKHDDAPYHRIVYLVQKKDSYPLQAQFFGVSGQKLKTMTTEKSAQLAGRLRPATLKMLDETTADRASWWFTKSIVAANVPDDVFTQAYLKGR